MLPQDRFDIQEYAISNIETYFENYVNYGSYLSFKDYLFTRLTVQLMHKYSRLDVQEAMDDPRMVAIVDFYTDKEEERNEDN